MGPRPEGNFAPFLDATRCRHEHPELGRCGMVAGHPDVACGVAVLEGSILVLHMWRGDETRRVEPGWWGMARRPLPWASGYFFPETAKNAPRQSS